MENGFKPLGPTKSSKPNSGGGVTREVPVLGVVKNNIDPTRSGRLQVYISDLGDDNPDESESWVTVSYMTPFYGFVTPKAPTEGFGDYKANPSSYGMWYSPPDLGTTVICIFINGDPNYGYWIGCVPKPEALYMVPAIGASQNIIANTEGEAEGYGGATRLPVTNINTNNESISDTADFLTQPKPVHSYSAMILNQQGLIRDPVRGAISSSAQRESPSRVGWGVSTPGRPIYDGGYDDATIVDAATSGAADEGLVVVARRGGHSIVLDDGDILGQDQLIRIRSAAGHQILMSDDAQTLFIIHSNGQSYIELGKEGTIDMYSTNSVNIRTQGDLNLHADNNININAKKKLNIKAEDINIESEKTTSQKVGTNNSVYTMGTFTHKVDGAMSMAAGGEGSYASGGVMYVNGDKVNLNTGATSTTPQVVPAIPILAQTDTLYDSSKGYVAAPGKLQTIVSRAPAHSPWANAGQGVDVKTSSSASSELPPAPSAAVEATNTAAAASTTAAPATPATIATVPPVTAASGTMDSNTTGAMVSASATTVAEGPASRAIQAGAGVVSSSQGPVAAVGALAQTPAQLESAGILKPGSATLVNSLVQGGSNVQAAMTNNLFTGVPGAENLKALTSNIPAQVNAKVTTFQQAQTALTGAGVITGKESPVATAGLIMAGASAGVGATLNTMSSLVSSSTINSLGKTLGAAANLSNALGAGGSAKALLSTSSAITSTLKAGNLAAGLAQTVSGGLGSIAEASKALNQLQGLNNAIISASRGPAAQAFGAILGTLKPLKVGIPQNLFSIARNALKTADAVSKGDLIKSATGALSTIGAIGGPGTSKITGALSGTVNAIGVLSSATTPAAAFRGLTGIIGGIGSVGSATGNKNVSQISKQVNSALSGANRILQAGTQLSKATDIAGSLNATANAVRGASQLNTALGGISALASGISNLPGGQKSISSVVNKSANSLTAALPAALAVGALVSTTLSAAKNNISPQLSLQGATAGIQGIAGGVTNAIASSPIGKLASAIGGTGLSSLTGGATSVASAVGLSNPASALSTVASLAGTAAAFSNPLTALTAGIPGGLTGGIPDIAGQLGGALDKLKSGSSSLSSLALSGLPPGAAAEINAAMSSLASVGASPVKLPTVASNTFDRSEITAQIGSLLGDPKIPKPNFTGEIPSAAKAALQAAQEKVTKSTMVSSEVATLSIDLKQAQSQLEAAEQSLPPGDPQLETTKEKVLDLVAKLEAKSQELSSLT